MPKSKPKFKFNAAIPILIVAFIFLAIGLYGKFKQPKENEAEKITKMIFDEHSISFVSDGVIDEKKLKEIQNMDYYDVKKYFNTKNDFCIYIEDGNGNILLAKGSSKLSENGLNCKE